MLKIYGDKTEFYQWDLDQKLIVEDPTINEVHFCNQTADCSLVCEVYKEGEQRLVNVPNILLQNNYPIKAYAYCDCATTYKQTFNVIMRSKPADYAYTETEVRTWENLNERITELELGNCAITDVEVLPTEDILTRLLYRTPEGVYWFADGWHRVVDETKLEAAIAEETERAQTAEKKNADNLEAHITAYNEKVTELEKADISNAGAIAKETLRATEAEQALDTKITNEISRQDEDIANATETANEAKETADTLDSTIQFALSHSTETREMLNEEIKRAIEAEQENAASIVAETTRSTVAEQAIRDALADFEQRVNALLESDDTTLNELQEIVDYIKNNKGLIEAITISKVSVSDIVDNLTSIATNKPLSANQGRVLKALIDEFKTTYENKVRELEAKDTENANAITAERNRASLAEQTNADAIVAEETRAKTAEATLTTEVENANTYAQNAYNLANTLVRNVQETQTELEAEVIRAKEAEQANATAISEETQRAQTAEQANATAIAREQSRAEDEEARIEGKLDTHIGEYNGKVAKLETSIGANSQTIANEIARSEEKDDEIEGRLDTVESIAKGANQAVSFDNYSEMITDLNALPNDEYNVGQNIMIVTVQVPDLWISAIADESVSYTYVDDETFATALKDNGSVQVGYYVLSQLETQKVDLTDYAKKGVFGYNDLQDRPFYDDSIQIKYSGNSLGMSANLVEGTAYLQTEKTYTLEELLGATVKYYNGGSMTTTTTLTESHISNQTENGITFSIKSGVQMFVVYSTDYKPVALYYDSFPATGIYFSYWDNGDPYRVDTLVVTDIKLLDSKYLPIAGLGKLGLARVKQEHGMSITSDGYIYPLPQVNSAIDNRTSYRWLGCQNVDYIVKSGLIANRLSLDDDEKASALAWLGAVGFTDYATANKAGLMKKDTGFISVTADEDGHYSCPCSQGDIVYVSFKDTGIAYSVSVMHSGADATYSATTTFNYQVVLADGYFQILKSTTVASVTDVSYRII